MVKQTGPLARYPLPPCRHRAFCTNTVNALGLSARKKECIPAAGRWVAPNGKPAGHPGTRRRDDSSGQQGGCNCPCTSLVKASWLGAGGKFALLLGIPPRHGLDTPDLLGQPLHECAPSKCSASTIAWAWKKRYVKGHLHHMLATSENKKEKKGKRKLEGETRPCALWRRLSGGLFCFFFLSLLEAKFADYDKQARNSYCCRRNLAGLEAILANPALSRWHFRNK